MRRLATVLLLAGFTLVPASPALAVKEVKIGASIHVEIDRYMSPCAQCGPNGTPMDIPSCNFVAVAQFSDYAGASAYYVNVDDTVLGERGFSGPPFYDNQEGWKTPRGVHWFGLSGGGGAGDCSDAEAEMRARYKIKSAVAAFDDKPRIIGTTTDRDGTPANNVRISISGASSASTHTNRVGAYSVRVKKGSHRVEAPKGFCAAGSQKCKNEQTVNVNGTENVSFVRRSSPLVVRGTIRDEFRRGLGSVRVRLTGPDGDVDATDAGGRYELRVNEPGTYELTATAGGRPRGPYERYYVVSNGEPTQGTAADVTLNNDTSPVSVDWELDPRLQFTMTTTQTPRADGFDRAVATVRALTQHGDPAPGVELRIDPPADAVPRAVICSTGGGSRVLWPSLNADGTISPSGLPLDATKTNAGGEVSFRIYPGTDPRPFTIIVSRRAYDGSVLSQGIPFASTGSRTFTNSHLARALYEGNVGSSFFGDQSVVFETLAVRQSIASDPLSGIDAVPVITASSKRQGIFFYTRGTVPTHSGTTTRVIGAANEGFVLENSLLARVKATPDLPTLSQWARGETVVVDATDPRTFLGWPIPTTANGGLGTCIKNGIRGENFMFVAHSPVRLLLTNKRGKRLGTDAKGKRHNEAAGAAFRDGTTSYVIAPAGSYKLTVIGTGSGPVALEARRDGATSVARFTARKGKTATFSVKNGALPKRFKFAGQRVRSVAGVPLVVKGLPRRLRASRKQKLSLKVTDAFGDAVPTASLKVTGASGGRLTRFANRKGRINATLRAPKKGRVKLTVRAADLRPVQVRVRVKAAR